MNKHLLILCLSASSSAAFAAGQTLSGVELDAVAAGGATATALADATGVEDATVSTYTYSGPTTNTPPAAAAGSSGNRASALLGSQFGGGSTGPVPPPIPQAQSGSTSRSSSSVNTSVVQAAPTQGLNRASALLQQMGFSR